MILLIYSASEDRRMFFFFFIIYFLLFFFFSTFPCQKYGRGSRWRWVDKNRSFASGTKAPEFLSADLFFFYFSYFLFLPKRAFPEKLICPHSVNSYRGGSIVWDLERILNYLEKFYRKVCASLNLPPPLNPPFLFQDQNKEIPEPDGFGDLASSTKGALELSIHS